MVDLEVASIKKKLFISKGYLSNHLDFKGIKNDFHSREFKIKNTSSLHSNEFNRYL